MAVLVVHSVKEDDPEEDEKYDKVDNKKDWEIGTSFVGVHNSDGVEGVIEKHEQHW